MLMLKGNTGRPKYNVNILKGYIFFLFQLHLLVDHMAQWRFEWKACVEHVLFITRV